MSVGLSTRAEHLQPAEVVPFVEGQKAMLLYDIDVRGLGTMRVAEHFTVKNGQIARLRQVHDTAAVRAAGLEKKP